MKSSNQSNNTGSNFSVQSIMLRGLLALIPASILGMLFIWALNTADGWLGSVVGLLWGKVSPDGSVEHYRFASLVLLCVICYGLGLLVTWKVGNNVFTWFEDRILQTPGIGPLYGFFKRIRDMISKSDARANYKRVVFVPFQQGGGRSIAFVTGEVINSTCGTKYITCFVPTPPNPFSGFAVVFPADQVSEVDMTLEQAFEFCISGGMACPAELALTPPTACALQNHTASE